MLRIVGPFCQLVTLRKLPLRGPLNDEMLEIKDQGAVLIQNEVILQVGKFSELKQAFPSASVEEIAYEAVGIPAYVDAHTHICFAGSRAKDFVMRNAGKSYLEIANEGGGIWNTVIQTRNSSDEELIQLILERLKRMVQMGITTIEIKSGYGLNPLHELRHLRCIQNAKKRSQLRIIATCLAAHTLPRDFDGSHEDYLTMCLDKILPIVKRENLSKRVDIFTEKTAFGIEESRKYLEKAKSMGFQLTVHADQFSNGAARMAVELGALSADHLEMISDEEIKILAKSQTVATILPGACLGLGEPFAPARKLLDCHACVAIASDWNPGSAPMGNLITQASIVATYQKLTSAEVFAGLTFRAAHSLRLKNLGRIAKGHYADFQAYSTNDYREILYHQGSLLPTQVWSKGKLIHSSIS